MEMPCLPLGMGSDSLLPGLPASAIAWTVQLHLSQIQDRSSALDKYNFFSLTQCQNCPALLLSSALFQVCLQSWHFTLSVQQTLL